MKIVNRYITYILLLLLITTIKTFGADIEVFGNEAPPTILHEKEFLSLNNLNTYNTASFSFSHLIYPDHDAFRYSKHSITDYKYFSHQLLITIHNYRRYTNYNVGAQEFSDKHYNTLALLGYSPNFQYNVIERTLYFYLKPIIATGSGLITDKKGFDNPMVVYVYYNFGMELSLEYNCTNAMSIIFAIGWNRAAPLFPFFYSDSTTLTPSDYIIQSHYFNIGVKFIH